MPDGNQSGQTLSPEKHNWKLKVWADFLDRFASARRSVFGKLVNMAESWQNVGKGPFLLVNSRSLGWIAAIRLTAALSPHGLE